MPTTILLVDDHPVFRKGLRMLLEEEQDFEVVGEAGDGQEAIALVSKLSPNVVIMDINMPNFNGIDATREIVADFPETKIVALSIHSGKRFIEDMLRAGAAGYILKEIAPEELVKGVRSVMRHEIYLSPSVTGIIVSEFVTPPPIPEDTGDYDGLTADGTIPIIRTKLHPPPLSDDHVHRPRLLKKLEKGRQNQLTLVSAPAGYGKSLLLSCWLENGDCPNAWFSADETDNNMHRFLIYFLTAIRTMFPDAVQKTLALANSANLPPMKVLTASLLNELNLIDQSFILVVDDLHLIQEKQVYDLLTELLRYPPQHMHLVLIGRRDPFLPISSFRARGLMTEIRLNDLSFTAAETKAYLDQMLGDQMEDAVVAKWTEKTEGWIAGLHLAALSIRHQRDAAVMLSDIPGGIQYATEYLFNEVFNQQSPEIRNYLLSTAILDRFCAQLCDALCRPDVESGETDISSRDFIDWLKKENLFIVNLDVKNQWFRYHHLFRQLLQNQLERHYSPEEIAALHIRAGNWFSEKKFIDEAINHTLAAGDTLVAARIVEQNRHAALDADQWHALEIWLDKLPHDIKQERPDLLLGQAWILLLSAQVAEIFPLIERIESLFDKESTEPFLLSEIYFFQGLRCYFQSEGARSAELFAKAIETDPKSSFLAFRSEAEYWNCLALHLNGQKEAAILRLEEGIRSKKPQEGMFLSRLTFGLCFIHLLEGDCLKAFQEGHRLREVSRSNRLVFAETWGMYVQGNAAFQILDLEAARHHLSLVMENRFIANPRAAVDALAGLAITCQLIGEPDDADETIRVAREYVQWLKDPGHLEILGSLQARLALLRGDFESASSWQRSLGETPGMQLTLFFLEIPAITECRVLITDSGEAGLKEALERLVNLRRNSKAWQNTSKMIDIMVLEAMASKRLGRLQEAMETLERAVVMAMSGGSIRPFVELGAPMVDLMNRLTKKNIAVDFVQKLLAAFGEVEAEPSPLPLSPSLSPSVSQAPQPLVEPLTNRELDILDLLAQRLQNKEIADKLFISPETVKTHLNNIYQKLGVTNRRNAVEKAKSLGIL